MINQYTIYSIDDSREVKKANIRQALPIEEVKIECVDGKDAEQLSKAQQKWSNIKQYKPRKQGELGIIYSTLNAVEYARDHGNLLAIEDDAIILVDRFWETLNVYLSDAPVDADFISIALPNEQRVRFGPQHDIGHPYLAKTYHNYNNVCTVWLQRGAQRVLDMFEDNGIRDHVDNTYLDAARDGRLNGYCLRPHLDIISIVAGDPTLVHLTEYVYPEEDNAAQ